jgi:hypothetical protein
LSRLLIAVNEQLLQPSQRHAAKATRARAFVYTQFSGQSQCFLTEAELVGELDAAGFAPEGPIAEYNRRSPSDLSAATGPVIYEGLFRRRG